MSATPHIGMAEPTRRLREHLPKLKLEPTAIVSLSTQRRPLTENVRLLPFADYLNELAVK